MSIDHKAPDEKDEFVQMFNFFKPDNPTMNEMSVDSEVAQGRSGAGVKATVSILPASLANSVTQSIDTDTKKDDHYS